MPIIPRLKRLFLSMKIAKSMRWHKERRRGSHSEDVMVHPADGDAWKALDEFDPEFARDPRSVRLGLATDGFTPFSTSASPYSCWPVFIMPYNLPPEMVLKDEFIFLALVIPGPKHPEKNLNVFLCPLIEELKQLWTRVKAYDSYTKKEFNLHAAYLCLTDGTIHKDLAQLSHGLVKARNYNRYDVSGFRFRTAKLEKSRPFAAIVNSEIMTTAYDANENLVHYYGVLQNIVKYEFDGSKPLSVVFFECDWFHPHNGTRVDNFGMVELKHGSKLQG
ncbi:hypothetical protein U9M48_031909 [Paspalum notatum var. saurae]|uniref:DUF4216 domain-containing protein n=1 Tax=Paspalum notatum var. saurae TaxID=547442 RepID=A0AAQ3X483_PASNO